MDRGSLEELQQRAEAARAALRAALLAMGFAGTLSRSALLKALKRSPSSCFGEQLATRWPAGRGARLPIEEATLLCIGFTTPRKGSKLKRIWKQARGAAEIVEQAALESELTRSATEFSARLRQLRARRLRGALSPLQRAHEALVDRVYAGELDGGPLCSEGGARLLPLFRGCVLGAPAEAERVFDWVVGGEWAKRQRPLWTHGYQTQGGAAEADARVAVLQGARSRLALCGNLVGLAEAELFFVSGESDPALVFEQLSLALQVWRPWALIFVSRGSAEEVDRLRALLIAAHALIGEELAAIKLWRPLEGEDAGRFLRERLWEMALDRGAAAWRRELLFVDAMLPAPPGELELEGADSADGVCVRGPGAWFGQTAVTQGLYQLVMGENPSNFEGVTRPVEGVLWEDGWRFANQLSTLAELMRAYEKREYQLCQVVGAGGFRVPFEAEWAWAARGGKDHKYAGSDTLDEVGWYGDDFFSTGNLPPDEDGTRPVGMLRANGYGLYDLSGNTADWCADAKEHPGQWSPRAEERATRGGSWLSGASSCRVLRRSHNWYDLPFGSLGLRLTRALEPLSP